MSLRLVILELALDFTYIIGLYSDPMYCIEN